MNGVPEAVPLESALRSRCHILLFQSVLRLGPLTQRSGEFERGSQKYLKAVLRRPSGGCYIVVPYIWKKTSLWRRPGDSFGGCGIGQQICNIMGAVCCFWWIILAWPLLSIEGGARIIIFYRFVARLPLCALLQISFHV
jgi:hypothetical protein